VKHTVIVLRTEYREMRRTTAFRIILIAAAAVVAAASAGITIALNLQPWFGEELAAPLISLFVSLVLYFLPLVILLAFIGTFGNLSIVKEKANGNLACLMATPLTPRALWMGKSLAIFLPAYITTIAGTATVVLVMNLGACIPAGYGFVLPVPAVVLGLMINPLLFFGLLLFMILYALAGDPDAALAPMFLLSFGLMMGIPLGLATGVFDLTSWSFALWYLAITVIAIGVVVFLSRMLTRQNIVLSSKVA